MCVCLYILKDEGETLIREKPRNFTSEKLWCGHTITFTNIVVKKYILAYEHL
jgi:hypothetical protein